MRTVLNQKTYSILAVVSSTCAFVFGFLVIVGWEFKIQTLKSVFPSYITMKANTAVGFLFLSASLWLVQSGQMSQIKQRISNSLALMTFLVGSLTLSQYLFGWDLKIDELLFLDPSGGRFPNGRLAPITAICFMLISTALVISTREKNNRYKLAHFLTFMTLLLSFQAFIGYLYGTTYTF